jgi:hypothetical protein
VAGEIANDLGYPAGSGNYEFTLISRQRGRTRLYGPLPDRTPEPETFEFTNVREGRYELLVVYLPVTGDGRRWQPHLGRATVEISDEDVTGLQVFMEPNTSIEGRILLDPSARERVPDVAALLPMLTLEEAMPRDLSLNPMIQRLRPVRADGTFTIPDAFPLTYRLSVMQHTLPPGVYLSAARLGPDNVLGVPFRVDPSTTGPLVLEVRGDGARLTGRVVSGPDPAADARIVLVPGGYWREEPTAYRTTRTGFDGRFEVEGIRPGAYTVYAFEDIPYGAWLDDLFMAPWLSRGVSVSLTPSESLERTLTLIQNGP